MVCTARLYLQFSFILALPRNKFMTITLFFGCSITLRYSIPKITPALVFFGCTIIKVLFISLITCIAASIEMSVNSQGHSSQGNSNHVIEYNVLIQF